MAVKTAKKRPAAAPAAKTRATAESKRGSAPRQGTSAQPQSARKTTPAGEEVVTMDCRRTGRRGAEPAAVIEEPAPMKLERRQKTQRRRQIDPTTCERDYSIEEVEFMNAMDEYKRKNGRMFPTCSEVLEVIRDLGYVKLSPAGQAMFAADIAESVEVADAVL